MTERRSLSGACAGVRRLEDHGRRRLATRGTAVGAEHAQTNVGDATAPRGRELTEPGRELTSALSGPAAALSSLQSPVGNREVCRLVQRWRDNPGDATRMLSSSSALLWGGPGGASSGRGCLAPIKIRKRRSPCPARRGKFSATLNRSRAARAWWHSGVRRGGRNAPPLDRAGRRHLWWQWSPATG